MELITESNEAYHARPEMSASMLKKLDESPRLFEAQFIKKTMGFAPTAAMAFGTAVHTAILEPEEFGERYAFCPAECSDRRTKKHKNWAESVGDKQILSTDDADRIERCCAAVGSNTIAAELLAWMTYRECSFVYTDQHTGVPCRVRFDGVTSSTVIDIKTVSDGSERAFTQSIAKYRYHLQAAHYLAGLRTIDPGTDWQFVFISVETTAPHRCRVYRLDSDSLMHAESQRVALLEDYQRRIKSGDWSEIGENEITELSLPPWAIVEQPLDWSGV